MKTLIGFSEYRKTGQPPSVFDVLSKNEKKATFHMCNGDRIEGVVTENGIYDFKLRLDDETKEPVLVPKIQVLLVYNSDYINNIQKHVKGAKHPLEHTPEPIMQLSKRNYIKNKTLYVLIKEGEVVKITILDNTLLRGLISSFNKYEIVMNIKDGTSVILLRHGVLNAQTKTNHSLLKTDQQKRKDWRKSQLYMEQVTPRSCSVAKSLTTQL